MRLSFLALPPMSRKTYVAATHLTIDEKDEKGFKDFELDLMKDCFRTPFEDQAVCSSIKRVNKRSNCMGKFI